MMNQAFLRAVAAAAALLAPCSAIGQPVGVTTAVRNTVQVRQVAGAQAKPAVVKQRVALGNQVDTGAQSAMQVMLLDKSTFTVGPNAKFTINSFVYDPARQRSSVASSVAKGTFRMLSGKAAHGGNNTISTPAATIGIRGTMVEGAVGADAVDIAMSQRGFAGATRNDPATASLIVLRGPGPRTQAGERPGAIEVTAGGRSIILTQPGMALYVPYAGAAPMGPFRLSNRGFAFFDAVLRTAPPRFAGVLAALMTPLPGAAGALANGSDARTAGGRAGRMPLGRGIGRIGRFPVLAGGGLALTGLIVAVSNRRGAPASP
jgi:hypothetical protein